VGLEQGLLSLMRSTEGLRKWKVASPVSETAINGHGGSHRIDHMTPHYVQMLPLKCASQRQSLSWHSSLAD
jgi:hypothetical protein